MHGPQVPMISNPGELLPVQVAAAGFEMVRQKLRDVHPDTEDCLPGKMEGPAALADGISARSITQEQFFFAVNTFLAGHRDAHLEIRYRGDASARRDAVNLPLHWLPEGLVVVRPTGVLKPGELVRKLGGLEAPELRERLRPLISSENDGRLDYMAARRLQRGDFLRELGVLCGGDLSVAVEARNGKLRQERLELQGYKIKPATGAWVGFDLYPQNSLGVFRFDRFQFDSQMMQRMVQFFAAVEAHDIRKVAVDLRGRLGGDSAVAFAFLGFFEALDYRAFSVRLRVSRELCCQNPQYAPAAISLKLVAAGLPTIDPRAPHYDLPAAFVHRLMKERTAYHLPEDLQRVADRELYLLTDAGTYSSGTLFALLVRDSGLGCLVGGATGNRACFNGNELRFDVPGTRFYLNIPSGKIGRPDPDLGDENAVAPDVRIDTTCLDVARGCDPQLEYIKSL